jgi:hypothetical protein
VSLGYSSQVEKIIIKGIWEKLQPVFMVVSASEGWLRIADDFNNICKMPNFIRIDEKHRPNKCRIFVFQLQICHSINLLGVADTNCCFALIDVWEPMDVKTIAVF